MKTKALISFEVTAKLICVFVFAYAKHWFSHDPAQLSIQNVHRSEKEESERAGKMVLTSIVFLGYSNYIVHRNLFIAQFVIIRFWI